MPGTLSSAATQGSSVVPGFARHRSIPAATAARIADSAPFIPVLRSPAARCAERVPTRSLREPTRPGRLRRGALFIGPPMKTPDGPARPSRTALHVLIALALAHAAWAIWLWIKLVDARRGGAVTCALGGGHCTEIW